MGTEKKSIDEIWKELNAKPVGRSATAGTFGLSGISMLPGITSVSRTVASKPDLGSVPAVEDVPINTNANAHKRASAYDPSKAGVNMEDLSAYMARIQRLVNCLSDPDRGTRRQSASALLQRLTKGDSTCPAPDAALLQALICGPLLYPLLGLMGDSIEKCRSISVELMTEAATKVADISPVMPELMVELPKRMGHLPVVEPSEEVRLQLTQLAAAIVARHEKAVLEPFVSDICLLLCRALEDNFHDIKKAACTCIVSLAKTVAPECMETQSERLVAALLVNLQHQHSRVRLACIEALDAVISCHCLPAGLIESQVAPGIKAEVYDRSPAVREALFLAVANWLGYQQHSMSQSGAGVDLSEAAADAAAKAVRARQLFHVSMHARAAALLPLLLAGVSDPQESTAKMALELVEAVGAVWEAEDRRTAAAAIDVDGAAAAASPMPVDSGEDAEALSTSYDHEAAAEALARQLGSPYTKRPSSGARHLTRLLLSDLLPPLLSELSEWTVALRTCAARQLHTVLVMSEDEATSHLPKLLPALCSAIGDEDADIAGRVVNSVHALGVHVPARRWMPLVLDHLSNSKLSVAQKANSLVVIAGLLHAAGLVNQPLPSDMLHLLATTLISEESRGGCEHPAVRQQLLAVATNVLRWAKEASSEVSKELYILLLQLHGFEKEAAKVAAVRGTMAQLASVSGVDSFEALSDQHAELVLDLVTVHSEHWSVESSTFLTFRALLLTASPAMLGRMAPVVTGVLRPLMANVDGEPNLRLSTLQLVDELLEDEERGSSLGEGKHARALLAEVLLPPMVWRAGKTAAAVRFAAINALSTLMRRNLAPPETLMAFVDDGTLLPLIHQCLDEDWYVDMRLAGCAVMQQLLLATGSKFNDEQRRAVYPELTKRLDDSSNAVRVSVCSTLVAFCTSMSPSYCDTNTGYLAQAVVIHMDDSDAGVQEGACRVLEALAAVKPAVVGKEVGKVRERFRNKHYCDRVLAVCESKA